MHDRNSGSRSRFTKRFWGRRFGQGRRQSEWWADALSGRANVKGKRARGMFVKRLLAGSSGWLQRVKRSRHVDSSGVVRVMRCSRAFAGAFGFGWGFRGQTRQVSFRHASHCCCSAQRGSRCLHHPNQELKTNSHEIRTSQSVSTSIHYTFFTLAYQGRIANPNLNSIESSPHKIRVPD